MQRKVTIPDSWAEVTLGQYMEFQEAMNDTDAVRRHARVVAAFTDLTLDECMSQIQWADLLNLSGLLSETLNKKPEAKLQQIIELDGVEFGFHPEVANMTAGEYVDLTHLDKGFWGDADKAMSILYRPVTVKIGEKYQIEKYDLHHLDNSELMRSIPMDVVQGAAAFFLTLTEALGEILQMYLHRMQKEIKTDLRNAVVLAAELLGTDFSTTLRMAISKASTTSPQDPS